MASVPTVRPDSAAFSERPPLGRLHRMPKGIVAIIGRPNVGKSTLYNRLIERRDAIVEDTAGVTRDRLYGTAEWNGEQFTVVDTGGFVDGSEDVFERAVAEQVELALQEADVILFMVDVQTGLTPSDEDVANLIRRHHKHNVLLVMNKVDQNIHESLTHEFYGLGIENTYSISALSGSGTGDVLDHVARLIAALPDRQTEFEIPRIAIVGRPNVGKSSFVNALLGRNENIVTPIAGTTRDSLYTRFNGFGMDCYLVDTAGLRRKARVSDNIEYYSTMRTLRAIEHCDVAILMLDATLGMEAQDLKILQQIQKHKKGLVILVNKWDLVDKAQITDRKFIDHIQQRIAPLSHIPIIFTSTVERKRLLKALEKAMEVYANRNLRIPTRELMNYMEPILQQTPPPGNRGMPVRIKFCTQVDGRNPSFAFFANHPKHVKESYARFLENRIREQWPFEGWPINIYFRQK